MRDPRLEQGALAASSYNEASESAADRTTRSGQGYEAVIVGASLAGCTAAIMFARAGARVALIDQRPEASAYKRICTHYIQSSAVPTLERLGLLEPMMEAGAVRSRGRFWTRWGWIEPPAHSSVPSGVNLRRELLDPLVRQIAAETRGVELMLGESAEELLRDARDTVCGVQVRDREGNRRQVHADLVVGADGRGSRIAKLAGVKTKTVRHGRFAYGAYFEGPAPEGAPDASLWFLDPDMAAAFPTDHDLTFYACMPTKERLPEFRRDPQAALIALIASLPDAPPIGESRIPSVVEGKAVQGKLDMTNVAHTPATAGLALVGDAALAIDPLWGVGCGWAFQSSEWLADSVAPALRGAEPLEHGLKRYRRRYTRALGGHAEMMYDYAGGRKFNRGERLLFSAAARDERVARVFEAFGTRNIGPARMLATGVPLALGAHARHTLVGRRSRALTPAASVSGGAG